MYWRSGWNLAYCYFVNWILEVGLGQIPDTSPGLQPVYLHFVKNGWKGTAFPEQSQSHLVFVPVNSPSWAISQRSRATLKACATVNVTAWAWGGKRITVMVHEEKNKYRNLIYFGGFVTSDISFLNTDTNLYHIIYFPKLLFDYTYACSLQSCDLHSFRALCPLEVNNINAIHSLYKTGLFWRMATRWRHKPATVTLLALSSSSSSVLKHTNLLTC